MNFFTFFEIFQIFLDFFNFFLLTNLRDLLNLYSLPILIFSNQGDKIASQKAHFAPCSSLQGGRILSAALIYCLSFTPPKRKRTGKTSPGLENLESCRVLYFAELRGDDYLNVIDLNVVGHVRAFRGRVSVFSPFFLS